MNSMLKAVSVAMGASVAALVLAGVVSSAHAQEVHIKVGDLNLQTPEGAAIYDQRVDRAAREMCANSTANFAPGYTANQDCMQAVRDEANANLTQQEDQLAAAGTTGVAVAAAQPRYAPMRAYTAVSEPPSGAGVGFPSDESENVRINVADLDLQTPEGAAAFDRRVASAARQTCASSTGLRANDECVAAFSDEANANLTAQEVALARANNAAAVASTQAEPQPQGQAPAAASAVSVATVQPR